MPKEMEMGTSEKPKNFKKSIKKLFGFAKKYLPAIIIAVVLSAGASICSIIGPDKLKEITNLITEGLMTSVDISAVCQVGLVLAALYGLSFVFNYIQSFIMAIVTNKFSKRMRREIAEKINRLPLSYFDKATIGDVLSRVTNDVDTIGQTLNQSIGTLVSAATMFIGSIIMMFYTNWSLALTAIVSSLLGFILMALIMKRSQKYFGAVQNGLGKINGHIEEVFTGHNVIRVYNATSETTGEFEKINEKLAHDGLKSQFYSGLMQPLMSFIGNFGYVAVCIVGALLAMNGSISFGVIVAFMMYVRLFTQPLTQFAQAFTNLQSAAAASERVFEFLDEHEMSEEKSEDFVKLDRSKAKGNLEFRNVKFGYDNDKVIIKNFNAKVKAGQKVAIVGPTGAGKTTIVNLLMKFYDIDAGDILIDGISTRKLTRENIHDLFTMVLQDTWLFSGTIRENVVYNKRGVSDEQVEKALETVGLGHYVKTLPSGINTEISDNLSAGQKQLLTIARCLIEDTPFLILDEATSSVDTRTEKIVQAAMDKLTKGKTSFIIAHRLSTIKNADLILVMKDGDIIEQGNHDKLLAKNGAYAELYNSQFKS